MPRFHTYDELGGANIADGDTVIFKDISDTTMSSSGTTKRVLASSFSRYHSTRTGKLNVLDYGASGNDSTDNKSAFDAVVAAAQTQSNNTGCPAEVIIPAGTYRVSGETNWFVEAITVRAIGKVIIKSTAGSGNVMTFDAGAAVNGYRARLIGEFVLDGMGSADCGLYVRNVQHGVYTARVRNVVTTAARTDGAVLSQFFIVCTQAGDTAFTTLPVNGIQIRSSAAVTATTACRFYLLIEAASGNGVVLTDADNNLFYGTAEGVGGAGVNIAAGCDGNFFDSFFMEDNVGGDVVCAGSRNEFRGCAMSSRAEVPPYHSVKSITFTATAEQNRVIGGTVYAGAVASGATANLFERVNFLYDVDDLGTRTSIIHCRRLNQSADIVPNFKPGNYAVTDPTVLDWYEEGTFTATFGGTTTDGTVSLSVNSGTFTRIGNRVFFAATLSVSSVTAAPTGNLVIRGLPYVAAASPPEHAVSVGHANNLTLPASRVQLGAYIVGGEQFIRLTGIATGVTATAVDGSGLGSSLIAVSGNYSV